MFLMMPFETHFESLICMVLFKTPKAFLQGSRFHPLTHSHTGGGKPQ